VQPILHRRLDGRRPPGACEPGLLRVSVQQHVQGESAVSLATSVRCAMRKGVLLLLSLAVWVPGCGGETTLATATPGVDAAPRDPVFDASQPDVVGPCTSGLSCASSGTGEFCAVYLASDGGVAKAECLPQLEQRQCENKPDACTCTFCPTGTANKCEVNSFFGNLTLVECAAP